MSRKNHRSAKRGPGGGVEQAARSTEARAAQPRGTAARGRHALDNWLFALALAGIALTAYLTLSAWFGAQPAFCGADSDCDLVQQSRWSRLLGVPIALWGLLTYAVLAHLTWRLRTRPSTWRSALLVAVVGAAVSWYLAAISMFVIEALCFYCLGSFAIANALLAVLLVRRPAQMPEHAWAKALPAPFGAALVIDRKSVV